MVIKYADVPQLSYGSNGPDHVDQENWRGRFPTNAQSMENAPERSASPVWVFEPSGEFHRAIFYKGQWQKLGVERDPRDGTSRLRMTGEAVQNPVRWASS